MKVLKMHKSLEPMRGLIKIMMGVQLFPSFPIVPSLDICKKSKALYSKFFT